MFISQYITCVCGKVHDEMVGVLEELEDLAHHERLPELLEAVQVEVGAKASLLIKPPLECDRILEQRKLDQSSK